MLGDQEPESLHSTGRFVLPSYHKEVSQGALPWVL